jgi:hypothetical protein
MESSNLEALQDKIAKSSKLIETAHGIWRAQTLSSALEFGVFDFLESDSKRPKSAQEIFEATNIKALRAEDVLQALAGMGHISYDKDT